MPETYTRQEYVYLARVKGTDLHKIGVSSDPERRVTEFGPPCELVHTVETYAPRRVEGALLNLLSDRITEGEWIECSDTARSKVISEMNSRKLDERPSVDAPTTPANDRAGRKGPQPQPKDFLPPLSDSETLHLQGLQLHAHRLVSNSEYTHRELADKLDVTPGSVAQAVTTTGRKLHKLQIRIVELLSDYEVERKRVFELHPDE